MKVLALELSAPLGSVAFLEGDALRVVRQFPADRRHSGFFYENLRAIHQECGPADVIVVGLGPGSYAGTRIALATALGLRAACGARLVGLASILAIDSAEYCVVGDARRNSFFFAHVKEAQFEEEPVLATADEVRAKVDDHRDLPIFASQPLPQFSNILIANPSAVILGELVGKASPQTEGPLEPIYLREPYITMPKR